MPLYEYQRDDGTRIEVRQAFSDEPLHTDPDTGERIRRVISAPSIIYRGPGFVSTSYRSPPKDKRPSRPPRD